MAAFTTTKLPPIKHEINDKGRGHIVGPISQDEEGHYWLSLLCYKPGCKCRREVPLLEEQYIYLVGMGFFDYSGENGERKKEGKQSNG